MAKKIYNENNSYSFGGVPFDIMGVVNTIHNPESNAKNLYAEYANMEIIPLTNAVPFPFIHFPLPVTDDIAEAIHRAETDHRQVVLATVNSEKSNVGNRNFLYNFSGVVVRVMKVITIPDGKEVAFIQAEEHVLIENYHREGDKIIGNLLPSTDFIKPEKQQEFEVTVSLVEEKFDRFMKMMRPEDSDASVAITTEAIGLDNNTEKDLEITLNRISLHAPIELTERIALIKTNNLLTRAKLLLKSLAKVEKFVNLRHKIFQKANEEISEIQKQQFLQSQIKFINEELNGPSEYSDMESLKSRAEQKNWNEDVAEVFDKELNKLMRFNPNSPDYSVQYGYLDTMLSLPWNNVSETKIDLDKMEKALDKEHFGLEKVKERIIEHMAVLKLREDMRSPILCLVGPPGVGKTSLCKSVADSINREYVRMSLGGLHDEAEIRGHRKTYIGAMTGRILSGLKNCTTNNPVFVLDEIDKIGQDYKGDPAQALLEVLDPEQNSRFHDNFLDIPYDLSKIFFIATANTTTTISSPLLDRMEIIDISGYILEEKLEIAKRHLVPKQLSEHGFSKNEIKFGDDALKLMIESYTRESGVRKLEKVIAAILRKMAVKKAKNQKYKKTVNRQLVLDLLGKPTVTPEVYEGNDNIGVVTGLAWTSVGGEILFIESALSEGKGELSLTGNLGDVMKESATIALQWLKSNANYLQIDPNTFSSKNVHIHVPEGAVPKDGPSAGITMLTSLASSLLGKKVKKGIAMTGEMTLRGKILPVGGIKEKILAAKRAGITEIILSKQNEKNIEEIGQQYLEGLSFRYMDNARELLSYVFE